MYSTCDNRLSYEMLIKTFNRGYAMKKIMKRIAMGEANDTP
jgi:hypothetical protein